MIRLFVDRPRNFVTWATLASVGLTACASPPEPCRTSALVDGMVATEAAVWRGRAPAQIARNIEVTLATGGEDITTIILQMWAWEVSNEDLQQALERSLELAELRAPSAQPASYRLEASLVGLDSPSAGNAFSVTATSTIDYKVSPISQGRTFQTVVVGVATYQMSWSVWSGLSPPYCEGLRLASDRAIRENIRSFIDQLVDFYGK